MKITISGTPGSGKSTVGKILSKKLKLKYFDVGNIRRKTAKKMNLSLQEYNKLGEKKSFTDKNIDNKVKQIGKKEKNLIVVGRTAYHFIPNSIKIFLKTSIDTGARRIFKEKRKFEKYKTLKETKKEIKERLKSDKKRYRKYYNIDVNKKENYDLIITTTNLTINQVVNKILKFIKCKEKYLSYNNITLKT
jgi:cytidylate kinase